MRVGYSDVVMKTSPLSVCFFALLCLPLAFAAKIPRGTYAPAQLEDARAKAKAEGKLIVYIETDTESSCPKCQWATDEAFEELRRDYVMVIEDDARGDKTDEVMYAAIVEQRKGGNFTPCITVVEPAKLSFVAGTDYTAMAKARRWDREFEKTVAAAKAVLPVADAGSGDKSESGEKKAAEMARDFKSWTNTDGQTIKAELIRVDVDQVFFRLEDGKVVPYPLSKLTEASRRLAMAGQ